MKTATGGEYLLWKGELYQVIACEDLPSIILESIHHNFCPKCGENLGKKQFSIIPTSPYFQENAEPVNTIKQ